MILPKYGEWPAVLSVGGLDFPVIADLPEGGRISIKPFADGGGTTYRPGPPLPPGIKLVLILGETAEKIRHTITEARAGQGGAEPSAAVFRFMGIDIPLLADMPQGGSVHLTRGLGYDHGPAIATTALPGNVIRVPLIPPGCMIAMLMGDVAERVRPMIRKAKANQAQQETDLLNGYGFDGGVGP